MTNMLQHYLSLHGITIRSISNETGIGYHTIQKTVTGERDRRIDRQAIADFLKLPYAHVWGKKSENHLANHIKSEIDRRLESQRNHLKRRYLINRETLSDAEAVSNG